MTLEKINSSLNQYFFPCITSTLTYNLEGVSVCLSLSCTNFHLKTELQYKFCHFSLKKKKK